MARKPKAINKTAGFSIAANNTNIKAIADRPCWAVRTLRWLFVRMPRAVWRWICNIDIHGLCNLTLMLLIIIFFSILIGQILKPGYEAVSNKIANKTPEITVKSPKNNVQIISNTVPDVVIRTQIKQNADVVIEEEKTIIITPFKASRKSTILNNPEFIRVNGDIIIDGEKIGRRLRDQTYINGNLIIQNMSGFTLPCGVKVNGNLIVRNINSLNFCGDFTVNGDIYVSADSSFGPIPRNAHILGQVIF